MIRDLADRMIIRAVESAGIRLEMKALAIAVCLGLVTSACDVQGSHSSPNSEPETILHHEPAKPGQVPKGTFSRIHYIAIQAGDEKDIRDNLERSTCFKLAASPAGADAVMNVEVFLKAPPGNDGQSYSIGDSNMIYAAELRDRKGKLVWRGSEGTYQRMIPEPGVHVDRDFYKKVFPLDAELVLLLDLDLAACVDPP